ncbi:GPI transamidase component PIG-T [Pisolithus orientalis]|uniref:GPI transamidase component PIG-T n=1 Tax=Pisolithus orientalis TaxID=936130 RepID=UPI0022240379|nr:GPI transamidase component PIG-T [Pisolithus orientalis]KAI6019826.1 GPI transamidase component PIG-T [Pisolithus orientalis]
MHWGGALFTLCLSASLAASSTNNVPSAISGERYNEDLFIRPLLGWQNLLEDVLRDSESSGQHYTLFPLTLGQILEEYSIAELHLTLNSGKWDYDHWGYPDDPSVGTGAELWAWMADGPSSTIDERWTGLRNALAGLFCASLGSLDMRRTSSPSTVFPISFSPSTPHALRYANLPSENVCTENLTPFVKLLPCKSHAGLATLLNPQRIFDADWHGLSIHLRSTEKGTELKLGVQAVFDPVRLSGGRRRDWSFRLLFDRMAGSSVVRVQVPDGESHALSPTFVADDSAAAVYNLITQVPLDVSMSWPYEHTFQYTRVHQSRLVPLSIQRTLRGSSQIHVGYFENLPALVTLWMHTMETKVDGVKRDDLISNVTYHPHHVLANGQKSPSTFQATLTIPAASTLHLSMEVSRAFLKYTEHPPDAMRGWDLPPAILFPVCDPTMGICDMRSTSADVRGRMYTPSLLIDLPTPDFSMPYNVIIFTCTLITLIFGSIFNLLTRSWVIVRVED